MNQLSCQSTVKNDFKNYDYSTHQFIRKADPMLAAPPQWLGYEQGVPKFDTGCGRRFFLLRNFQTVSRTRTASCLKGTPPPVNRAVMGANLTTHPPSNAEVQMYEFLLITSLTHFFMYLFISSLYTFRASQRSSSGDRIVRGLEL